jgi:hypothetical protein
VGWSLDESVSVYLIPWFLLQLFCFTELILGRGGLEEESNYDYSKLKKKEKERKSNASYFTINTSVCVR